MGGVGVGVVPDLRMEGFGNNDPSPAGFYIPIAQSGERRRQFREHRRPGGRPSPVRPVRGERPRPVRLRCGGSRFGGGGSVSELRSGATSHNGRSGDGAYAPVGAGGTERKRDGPESTVVLSQKSYIR